MLSFVPLPTTREELSTCTPPGLYDLITLPLNVSKAVPTFKAFPLLFAGSTPTYILPPSSPVYVNIPDCFNKSVLVV